MFRGSIIPTCYNKQSIKWLPIPKVIKTKRMQFHFLEVVEVDEMFVWKKCLTHLDNS
jgi:hypothetical protein